MAFYRSPTEYRTTHWLIAENARAHPDKPYIISVDQDEKAITYGGLRDATNRIAHFLKRRGFGKLDRVLLLAENSLENMVAYLGMHRYGATLATVNVEMNRAQLAQICRAVNPKIVLYQPGLDLEPLRDGGAPGEWIELGEWFADGGATGFFAALAGLPAENDDPTIAGPDDPCVIYYTSGTTANAKGVICSHATMFYNFDGVADFVGLRSDDTILDFRSYSWSSAMEMSLGGPLTRGATVVMMKRFSQSRYFDWIRKYKVNIGVCVPTGLNMFINRPVGLTAKDMPHLRFITSSSAPLLLEQWKKFEDMYGIPVAQGYGSSEGGWTCGSNGETRRHGSVGKPLCYQQLRIVDDQGDPVAAGEAGEIIVGGKQLAMGYLMPDGAIVRLPEGDWRTGDIGVMDRDGYVTITGRARDLIIRGGVNIAPVEIDGVLMSHADVAEAGTIGVPHEIYGEEVVSFVTCRAGIDGDEAEILAHCRVSLAASKAPK
ncbi:MAG: class I adenylate-forming enzyme family protein, partial [Alphaproteobacteria bacterium]